MVAMECGLGGKEVCRDRVSLSQPSLGPGTGFFRYKAFHVATES